jgi:hypothetical protein
MPLGFLPRDTIGPPRPMPAPAPAPHVPSAGSEPEPIADPPTRVTRTRDPSPRSTRPQRSQSVEPVWAEPAMPLGFEELPAHDERYQGQIYGPSKPGPDTVPAEGPDDSHQDADEPTPEDAGTAGSTPSRLQRPRLLLRRVSLAPLSTRALIGLPRRWPAPPVASMMPPIPTWPCF